MKRILLPFALIIVLSFYTGAMNIYTISRCSANEPCLISYNTSSNETSVIATFPNIATTSFIRLAGQNIFIGGSGSEISYYNPPSILNSIQISWITKVNLDTGQYETWEIDAYGSIPQFGSIISAFVQDERLSQNRLVLPTVTMSAEKKESIGTQLVWFDYEHKNYSFAMEPIWGSLFSGYNYNNNGVNILWLASYSRWRYENVTQIFAYNLFTHQFVYNGSTDDVSKFVVSNLYYVEEDVIFAVAALDEDYSVWLCHIYGKSTAEGESKSTAEEETKSTAEGESKLEIEGESKLMDKGKNKFYIQCLWFLGAYIPRHWWKQYWQLHKGVGGQLFINSFDYEENSENTGGSILYEFNVEGFPKRPPRFVGAHKIPMKFFAPIALDI